MKREGEGEKRGKGEERTESWERERGWEEQGWREGVTVEETTDLGEGGERGEQNINPTKQDKAESRWKAIQNNDNKKIFQFVALAR